MPVAVTTCPACGYDTADPEFLRARGLLVAVAFTCRLCGNVSMLTWGDDVEGSYER
jgi:hypothetical protein